jgi:hypothetical protein
MRYRGALEINRQVRDEERRQLILHASEWSPPRPARRPTGPPLRRWLAAALHALAVRIEPQAAGWKPQVQAKWRAPVRPSRTA